ncbi:class I SAM-dependent methyltransferase [Chryseobacterium indologenes]|uniref:methyltransferase n=1 Tax=Chryseobacterium indologenes TaxID=253 RepID=UPI0016262316|nr:methyltransferase [Chryseobacterium indologenes]
MKLSKEKIKLHNQAEEYLKKDVLTFDEKLFILENWNEAATNINSSAGAFFTPIDLAKDFSLVIYEKANIVDLCAGIGMLSFFAYHHRNCKVTCIELNPDYVRVGKKILPEANWINDSITEVLHYDLPKFKQAISNPPFGKIKTGLIGDFDLKYKGSEFEYITIGIASKIAEEGSFILPQQSTPFKYSGERNYSEVQPSKKLSKFFKETGFEMNLPIGIDTSVYLDTWNGVSPMCEVVDIDFTQTEQSSTSAEEINLFNY